MEARTFHKSGHVLEMCVTTLPRYSIPRGAAKYSRTMFPGCAISSLKVSMRNPSRSDAWHALPLLMSTSLALDRPTGAAPERLDAPTPAPATVNDTLWTCQKRDRFRPQIPEECEDQTAVLDCLEHQLLQRRGGSRRCWLSASTVTDCESSQQNKAKSGS